jgi:hypothetical protein
LKLEETSMRLLPHTAELTKLSETKSGGMPRIRTLEDKLGTTQDSFRQMAKAQEELVRTGKQTFWDQYSSEVGLASVGGGLTSEAVDVEAAVLVRESRLVGKDEEGLDARQTPTTALTGCNDGVAHTAISQPAWAAAIQATIPGCIQLASGGNLCTPLPAVCPCLLQCQLVWRGT